MARQKNRLPIILSFVCITFLLLTSTAYDRGEGGSESLPPIDPQQVRDQDLMTWDDYHPIPGKNWADPSLKPERGFRLAVVAIDFPDQPFVISLPKGSDPFGNPQIDPVNREDVSKFYADFFWTPSKV
ncbi:MAG: peptidase M6, partial [Candidatus Aminicenantes bacterium]|nr:peptidase M6 [Candidatus Aminicenantes bacterium]